HLKRQAKRTSQRLSCLVGFLAGTVALTSITAFSQGLTSVTLAWDPSADPDVAGYHLYWGLASGPYITNVDTGSLLSNTIPGLTIGTTYYFAATAYDTNGNEGAYSTELSYTVTNWPPSVTLSASSPGGVALVGPAIINLSAAVNPNGHTIAGVQFFN